MPKPVPPPPPQTTVEETAKAVRLVRILCVVFVLLFGLISLQYRVDGWAVEYGRSNGASWNLKKLHTLDVDALRGDEDHRIVWLVGSSILRESFDEDMINQSLEEAGADYRVAKFGQTRGAAGLSWGIVRRLPLNPVTRSSTVSPWRTSGATGSNSRDCPDGESSSC